MNDLNQIEQQQLEAVDALREQRAVNYATAVHLYGADSSIAQNIKRQNAEFEQHIEREYRATQRRQRWAACFPPWVRWSLGALLVVGIIAGAVVGGVLGVRSTRKSSSDENNGSPPITLDDSHSDPEAMNMLLPANGSALALSAYESPAGIVRTVYFQLPNDTLAYSTLHPNLSSTTGLLGLTADPLTPIAETNWSDETSSATQQIRLYYLSSGVLTSAHSASGTWSLGDLHSYTFKPAADSKIATTNWPGDIIVNRTEWVYYAQPDGSIAEIGRINNTWSTDLIPDDTESKPLLKVASGSGLATTMDGTSGGIQRLWLFGQSEARDFVMTGYNSDGNASGWEAGESLVYQPPGNPLAGNLAVATTWGEGKRFEAARLFWVDVGGVLREVEWDGGEWSERAREVEGVLGTEGAAVAAESVGRGNVRVYVVERKSGRIKEFVRGVWEGVWAEGNWKVGELDGG